jgi:hypothetical protein
MAYARTLKASPAGHPFRRSLPGAQPVREEDHDLKLFVLSFTAFFICIYSFIY